MQLYKNVKQHRHSEGIGWHTLFDWGPPMTTRSDHHSDFEAGQLTLFVAVSVVLLVFALTLF